jgi:hypothetical protein
MTLFSWFKKLTGTQPKRQAETHADPLAPSPRGTDPARAPVSRQEPSSTDPMAQQKAQRQKMREQLHNVVRESMVRVGILSSNFKFKVLATDPKGQKFIVMMDLPPALSSDITQLAEIEPVICRAARVRYNISVTAVYWRAELPAPAPTSAPAPVTTPATTAAPAPATSMAYARTMAITPDAAARQSKVATPAAPTKPAAEPVLDEEVSALKRIFAASTSQSTLTTPPHQTGFESTALTAEADDEMPTAHDQLPRLHDGEDDPFPLLGPTQYGDLR